MQPESFTNHHIDSPFSPCGSLQLRNIEEMGRKKLGFGYLFFRGRDPARSSSSSSSSSSYSSSPSSSPASLPWPSCKHPRTHCLRASVGNEVIYKTMNSVYYFDSGLTSSSSECSESMSDEEGGDAAEAVIRGLRSERLFFENATKEMAVEEEEKEPFEESVAMAMESEDPYRDFRESMEEVVAARGVREWGRLQEMLVWYLRVNAKKTHGFVVGAFVDLVMTMAMEDQSDASAPSSSSSGATSRSVSFEIEELKDDDEDLGTSNGS